MTTTASKFLGAAGGLLLLANAAQAEGPAAGFPITDAMLNASMQKTCEAGDPELIGECYFHGRPVVARAIMDRVCAPDQIAVQIELAGGKRKAALQRLDTATQCYRSFLAANKGDEQISEIAFDAGMEVFAQLATLRGQGPKLKR